MRAVILAGGYGTRLARELPPGLPKILAPVAGRPFADYVLTRLARCGVRYVTFAAGYGVDALTAYAGSRIFGMGINYSVEDTPLGTGGALREALQMQPPGTPTLAMNGDVMTEASPDAFLRFYARSRFPAALACAEVSDTGRFGVVRFTPRGRLTAFAEAGLPGTPGVINAGMYLLPSDFFPKFAPAHTLQGPCSAERDVFPEAFAACGAGVYVTSGGFLDIGVPADYARAQTLIPAWQPLSSF